MMIYTYAVYLMASLAIAIWVGTTLSRNGRTFLVENFEGKEELADSINHLLLVGFYLVNLGFVSLALRYGDKPVNTVEAIEFLSTKIGLVVVVIGFMHFFNMRMLLTFRRSSIFKVLQPEGPKAAQSSIWDDAKPAGTAESQPTPSGTAPTANS
ncbi:MAG: hypothetical protein OER56_04275 [Hyphomicrobiales bacterium]|nr:hypothetical protein [Hyphomicrobiales bacterium]